MLSLSSLSLSLSFSFSLLSPPSLSPPSLSPSLSPLSSLSLSLTPSLSPPPPSLPPFLPQKPADLEVVSSTPYQGISQEDLTSLYDSYITKDNEFRRLMKSPPLNYVKQYQHVTACVKLLCERAGFIEPFCLSEAIFNLKRACQVAMGRDSFSTTFALDVSTH